MQKDINMLKEYHERCDRNLVKPVCTLADVKKVQNCIESDMGIEIVIRVPVYKIQQFLLILTQKVDQKNKLKSWWMNIINFSLMSQRKQMQLVMMS